MKLEDVQQKIDSYLDSISGEELLQTLTDKYSMSEYDMNDSDAIPDEPTVGNAMIALDQAGYWFCPRDLRARICSHRGNGLFPACEWFVPSLGMF